MGDLSGWNPLVDGASSGKLRLVRLLVEGGADVNGRSRGGDTALLAACKNVPDDTAAGSEWLKLVTFLLQSKADPNVQDHSGRSALMLACLRRSTAVVSRLLLAGADPTSQDRCGASALVYAVNAQHPPTFKMIVEACRAKGRDVIIIVVATDIAGRNGPTKHRPSLPPSPDPAPAAPCTSPSGIVLKTSPPNAAQGGHVFSFRTSPRGEANSVSGQRGLSEPRLTIPHLAYLHRAYKRGITLEDQPNLEEEHNPGVSKSQLPPCPMPRHWGRRNTMPELTSVPHAQRLLHLRNKSISYATHSELASKSVLFLPRPPSTAPPPSAKGSFRAALLRPRCLGTSASFLTVPTESCQSKEIGKHKERTFSR